VIVVDDGVAGGATLRAAALALRRRRPRRLIAAVPVGSAGALKELRPLFDEVAAVHTPEPFGTVSAWYEDFGQIDDAGVLALVGRQAGAEVRDPDPSAPPVDEERPVAIPLTEDGAAAVLLGDLGTPCGGAAGVRLPLGLVLFAPGGGSSRRSYRNRYLAARLRLAGWATLRLDLLLDAEQRADAELGELRFDIARLTRRLRAATEWCVREGAPGSHRIVLFGASTGAAAAAGVAAALPDRVAAVVARAGRIDLAETDLSRLTTATLLVAGGADELTLRVNREAAGRLAGPVALEIIPSAGHTFEEPGALGRVGEVVASRLERLTAGANRRARRPPW
jgi:putative phosphoribosyl transferase